MTATQRAGFRRAAVILSALALAPLGADGPSQTIEARGLSFKAPKDWKSVKLPPRTMRLSQLKIDPAKGDEDPAELVVFAFPGGGGGVDANVKRWEGQFQDKNGGAPTAKTEKRKGKNVDVTFVDLAGRYVAAVTPAGAEHFDKPNYHLLGAIIITDDLGYFVRLVGPEKTVVAAKSAFDDLIKSMEVDKK